MAVDSAGFDPVAHEALRKLFKETPRGVFALQGTLDASGNPIAETSAQGAEIRIATNHGTPATASTAIVPNTDLTAIVAADLIAWTAWASSLSRNLNMIAAAVADGTGQEYLGWWFTVNAESASIARTRLLESLSAGNSAYYVASGTIDADTNCASFVVPIGVPFPEIVSTVPITDVYVMPVAAVTDPQGLITLTAVLS